jgi:hypothetical protein
VYTFDTIKPGPVEGRNGRVMVPHVNFWIVARGINIGLNTRMYFSDETAANAKDPVLNMIEWGARRKTLIAECSERDGQVVYRFDIVIQGDPARRCSLIFDGTITRRLSRALCGVMYVPDYFSPKSQLATSLAAWARGAHPTRLPVPGTAGRYRRPPRG